MKTKHISLLCLLLGAITPPLIHATCSTTLLNDKYSLGAGSDECADITTCADGSGGPNGTTSCWYETTLVEVHCFVGGNFILACVRQAVITSADPCLPKAAFPGIVTCP